MTNDITVRLDEQTFEKIRQLAVDQHTSVSAWVSELVTRTVEERDRFERTRRHAPDARHQPVAVQEGPLTREQAHEG